MLSFNLSFGACLCAQFNFVGRILGPRGLTAKQLESETGCKIMVRGKGSMRDKKKVYVSIHHTRVARSLSLLVMWHLALLG